MAAHIVYDGKGVPVNHVSNVGLSLHSSCPINRPCFTQNWNHMDELSETTLEKKTLRWTNWLNEHPPKKNPQQTFPEKGFSRISTIPYSNFYKKYHLFKTSQINLHSPVPNPHRIKHIESEIPSGNPPGLRNLRFTVGRSGFLDIPGWISTWWESQDGTTRKANWNDHL